MPMWRCGETHTLHTLSATLRLNVASEILARVPEQSKKVDTNAKNH